MVKTEDKLSIKTEDKLSIKKIVPIISAEGQGSKQIGTLCILVSFCFYLDRIKRSSMRTQATQTDIKRNPEPLPLTTVSKPTLPNSIKDKATMSPRIHSKVFIKIIMNDYLLEPAKEPLLKVIHTYMYLGLLTELKIYESLEFQLN